MCNLTSRLIRYRDDKQRKAAILTTAVFSVALLPMACVTLLPNAVYAQTTTATLSGNVVDSSNAIIPGADVILLNSGNGSVRRAKSNSSGSFVFAAVPTGDYTVTVKFNGFKSSVIEGIHLNPQDTQNLSKILLQVGEVSQEIEVSASDSGLSNSGERSTLITAKDIQKLSIEGRDVGELVKMLPGFAIAQTSGSIDNQAYDPSQVSVTGALRSYSANGNAANGVTLLSDGANVSDPGNYGDSTQNVNSDMVEEVKVQTSNFTAETSNGPHRGECGRQVRHQGLPRRPVRLRPHVSTQCAGLALKV